MITPAQAQILFSTVDTMIGAAWQEAMPLVYPQVCEERPSASTQQVYVWTGMLPKMRLWEGGRVVFEPALQTYTLANQLFESTLAVDRFRMSDDLYASLWRDLPDMARQARRNADFLLRDLQENTGDQTGVRQLGLDGLPGFSTNHPVDLYDLSKGHYSNDFSNGGATVQYPNPAGGTFNILTGGAMSGSAVLTLSEYMRTLKGEDGESLGIVPNLIEIAPQLMGETALVLKSSFMSPPTWGSITGQVGPAENVIKKFGIDYVVNPFLRQAYTWYMMDTKRGFKPFVHQTNAATKMVSRVAETDQNVFDRHEFLYGQWAREAVGWGPAWLCCRSGA